MHGKCREFQTFLVTPLWYILFKPEVAQTTHLNYGHLLQAKPPAGN